MPSLRDAAGSLAGLVRRARTGYVDSANYWERRYSTGNNSGGGSYGAVADYKADFLNSLVVERRVESVIEFGCGDGNQLSLASYPRYIGLDVSRTAVAMCAARFRDDSTKSFLWYDPQHFVNNGAVTADLGLSLDVLLHLVENDVYETYLSHLFGASGRLVAIFSPDRDEHVASHVRYRKFTPVIAERFSEWNLVAQVPNDLAEQGHDTAAEFFIYERT